MGNKSEACGSNWEDSAVRGDIEDNEQGNWKCSYIMKGTVTEMKTSVEG